MEEFRLYVLAKYGSYENFAKAHRAELKLKPGDSGRRTVWRWATGRSIPEDKRKMVIDRISNGAASIASWFKTTKTSRKRKTKP